MSNILYRYRVYCITEGAFVTTWGTSPPTTCPTVAAHSINALSVQVDSSYAAKRIHGQTALPYQAGFYVITADASNGDLTVDLPPASRYTGMPIVVANTGVVNNVILTRFGSDTFDGGALTHVIAPDEFVELRPTGAGSAWVNSVISPLINNIQQGINTLSVTHTKGSLLVDDGTGISGRKPGVDGQVLMADSSSADGLAWSSVTGSHESTLDPVVTDDIGSGHKVGTLWVNTVTKQSFVLVDNTINSAIWQLATASVTDQVDEGINLYYTEARVDDRIDTKVTDKLGVPNGIATLDAGGKIPSTQLSMTSLSYKGTWDASNNTPTLASGETLQGYYYVINVAGSITLDGINDWAIGDWVINNGSAWEKADHTDSVTSVAGKQGAITLDHVDIVDFDSAVENHTRVQSNFSHSTSTNNPHSVTKTQVGLSNVQNVFHNYTAVTSPGVNDDNTSNFSIGSIWLDTMAKFWYTCTDASTATAIWLKISHPIIDNTWNITDTKLVGTPGGSATESVWNIREINTLQPGSSSSANLQIGGNTFTLAPGDYTVDISSPAYRAGSHQMRLYNVTAATVQFTGTVEFNVPQSNRPNVTRSVAQGVITVGISTTFRVEHMIEKDNGNNMSFGRAGGFTNEIYTCVNVRQFA